jgi:two-component system sensor histidine kinase ChiS
VDIFEVYEADPQPVLELKEQTRREFEEGVALYLEDHFAQAQQIFEQVLRKNQQDRATQLYIKRCQRVQNFGASELNGLIS